MTTVLVLPSSLGTTTKLWEANVGYWSDTLSLLPYNLGARRSVDELGEDLMKLLDERGLERVSLCGISLGGATAMRVAATAPERVDRLVLACTSARFGDPEPWLERAALVRQDGLESIADGIVARWFTDGAAPEVIARFRRQLVETPNETYAAGCEAVAHWDFGERLSSIQAPTLVIAAAEDRTTPPDHGELIVRGIPNARLVVLPDAAHLANVERAETFSRLVTEHLAAVEVA
jgi:3-oxoadipate enol-lactonase